MLGRPCDDPQHLSRLVQPSLCKDSVTTIRTVRHWSLLSGPDRQGLNGSLHLGESAAPRRPRTTRLDSLGPFDVTHTTWLRPMTCSARDTADMLTSSAAAAILPVSSTVVCLLTAPAWKAESLLRRARIQRRVPVGTSLDVLFRPMADCLCSC